MRGLEGGSARTDRALFSIITSSFNQGHFLEETLRSVQSQGRNDVEHIVLDGGSTDGSVDILRKYDGVLSYWCSASDDGQSAAWNSGVARSRGSIIGFLNSDDLYLPGALDAIARLAGSSPEAEWFVGGTRYFGEGSGDLVFPGRPQRYASDVLFYASYAPQPGHFLRRALLDRVGAFDESLQYSFDWDYFVRCALAGASSVATAQIVAAFRFHDASKSVTMKDLHRAETDLVESRYWSEIERREGSHARSVRADLKGHAGLTESRDALRAGHRALGWSRLLATTRAYPSMVTTRAWIGTVQRLLGLRPMR